MTFPHHSGRLSHPSKSDTIREDKAAAVAYLRVKNQEGHYVTCVIVSASVVFRVGFIFLLCRQQRSMVYNALIGSISFAKPGAKALHTAATAQEVTICTPALPHHMQLAFRVSLIPPRISHLYSNP